MTESSAKSEIKRYRLPVKFDGAYIIHPVDDDPDLDNAWLGSKVEERWIQKEKIGKGGFGEVWLQEEKGGELRAVKRLAQVVQGVDYSRELVALATLRDHHRSFVKFYGWYEDIAREFVFLAMEYIAGGDLTKYIKDPIIRTEAREITKQLLQGLAIMHERRICHRDIKPANILVVSLAPMWVKLADFGVSKLERDTYLRTQTGTIAYSAPELFGLLPNRLRPRDVYTNAVDMWSLGCLVHEMLTTERPFIEQAHEVDPESSLLFDTCASEPQIDIDMLIDYCRDERCFPEQALKKSGGSVSQIRFVKALLLPDPHRRISAVNALASPWMLGEPKPGIAKVPTIMLGSHERLKRWVERNSLQMFYPEIPAPLVTTAEFFATELLKQRCPRGIAASLEELVLYDLVILIGDSDSMKFEQNGNRIKLLQKLLEAITGVYNLATGQGILSVQFLNATKGKKNVIVQNVQTLVEGHDYGGMQRVGTELKQKIIDKFVLETDMKKPLLVIVITDQVPEGESSNMLESVLKNCISELSKEGGVSKEPYSTAFQFLHIGDGFETLRDLADVEELSEHVNFRKVDEFNHIPHSTEFWNEITHILLGAITDKWR